LNLQEQLESMLQGRICLMGLGNPDCGDDGLGVRLCEQLLGAGVANIVVAATEPEHYIGAVTGQRFDHIIFIDAVEFGGSPGDAVFLDAAEIEARFPQVSTHKLSLSLLAKLVASNGISKTWVLGVQPESMREGQGLSPKVRITLDSLCKLLFRLTTREVLVC